MSQKTGVRLQLASVPFEELKIEVHAFDRCCHPWLYAVVKYDGRVTFCDHLMHFREDALLGFLNQPKEDVWNGAMAKAIRKKHIRKKLYDLPFKCRKCYVNGRYADHEGDLCDKFSKWQVSEKEIKKRLDERGDNILSRIFRSIVKRG